jgi:hypothetical protein
MRSLVVSVVLLVLAAGAALAVPACKDVAEKVAEKGMKAAKDTTKGLAEGIEKGRKQGQSADDATIVSDAADLKGKGLLSLRQVRASAGDPKHAEIELVFENVTGQPLRITNLDVLALDKEGFAKRPTSTVHGLTVPAKAKEKLVVTFDAEARSLVTARVWGVDHQLSNGPPGK